VTDKASALCATPQFCAIPGISHCLENALWCGREFGIVEIILFINIKGLLGIRSLWRAV
jgi:hypothetical protein